MGGKQSTCVHSIGGRTLPTNREEVAPVAPAYIKKTDPEELEDADGKDLSTEEFDACRPVADTIIKLFGTERYLSYLHECQFYEDAICSNCDTSLNAGDYLYSAGVIDQNFKPCGFQLCPKCTNDGRLYCKYSTVRSYNRFYDRFFSEFNKSGSLTKLISQTTNLN